MAVTLTQIAEACGVSRSTVDRALREKGQVREELSEKIKQTARELGYIPMQDSGRKELRIGVLVHSASTAFVKVMLKHIQQTTKDFEGLSVEVILRLMGGQDAHQQVALIDELVYIEQVDCIALMPLASELVRDKINWLSEVRSIPVVTFNTDIADANRLAYVGPDNLAAGKAAASLLGLSMKGEGQALAITGRLNGHFADSQRLMGFMNEIQEIYPDITLNPPEQCFNDASMAERITLRALENFDNLKGIYVSSAGRRGVYSAVEKAGMSGKIHIVVHDIIPTNLRMIESGMVDFVIGQGVKAQGTLPIRLLYDFMFKKKQPENRIIQTDIEVKFRYNLGSYL